MKEELELLKPCGDALWRDVVKALLGHTSGDVALLAQAHTSLEERLCAVQEGLAAVIMERDAALARAEKAERERDALHAEVVLSQEQLENFVKSEVPLARERANAAEDRERKLVEQVTLLLQAVEHCSKATPDRCLRNVMERAVRAGREAITESESELSSKEQSK